MATFKDILRKKYQEFEQWKKRPAPLVTKTPAFQKVANIAENIAGGLQKGAFETITAPINLLLPKKYKIKADPFKGNALTRAMYGQKGQIFQEPQSMEASIARGISEAVPATVVGSQMLKAFKPTAKILGSGQRRLGELATREPFKNKLLQNLYSKGVLNVAEGLPYSAGLYMKNLSQGEGVTGQELGTDIAFDLATGALPFIGLGASILDKPIREGLEEGITKSGKESVKDRALKKAQEPLTKAAKESLEQEKAFRETMNKQNKDMASMRQILAEKQAKLQDAKIELSDSYKARKGIKGTDTPEAVNVARAEIQAKNAQEQLDKALAEQKAVSQANSSRIQEILQQEPSKYISTPKAEVPVKNATGRINIEVEDVGYKTKLNNLRNTTNAELEAQGIDFNRPLLEQIEVGGNEGRGLVEKFTKMRDDIYFETTGKRPSEFSKVPEGRYVPRVLRGGGLDIDEVVGFDATSYSPYTARTGKVPLGEREMFYNSIDEIIDADIRAIEFRNNAIKEEAIRRNVPEEVVQNEARVYKEIADKVHEGKGWKELGKDLFGGGKKTVNPYREMLKNAKKSGIEVGNVEIDANLTFGSGLRTDFDFLEKLGILDAFEPYVNYRDYVTTTLSQTKGMDWREQLDVFVKQFGWEDLYNKFPNIERVVKQMNANGENPERYLKGIYMARAKKQGLEHLNNTLPTYKFTGKGAGKITDRLDDILTRNFAHDVLTKSAVEKGLAKIRRTFVGSLLGLKPRSALQNITEIKRAFATTDSRIVLDAMNKARVDKGEIYERFPSIGDVRMWDEEKFAKDPELKKSLANLADEGHEKAVNAVMTLFSKAEDYKNKVFAYAYEQEALEKGLTGKQITNYVKRKFNKYAITGDVWNTPAFFKNDINRTIFQFSQYPVREITILADSLAGAVGGNKEDLVRFLKFGSYSASVAAFYSWAFNWDFQDSFMPVPFLDVKEGTDDKKYATVKFGPLVGFIQEVFDTTKNYLEVTDEEAEKGERMSRYEREQASKIPSMLTPGGSQLRSMALFGQDVKRGYRPTRSDNVRAPQGTNMADMLRGFAFGPYSTETVQKSFDITDTLKGSGVLNKTETANFASIKEAQGISPANQYYEDKMMGRTYKDKNVKDLFAKKDSEYKLENPTSELTPSDVFSENIAEDNMWKEINAGVFDADITKEQRDIILGPRLQKYGLTRKDWELHEMKGNKYTVKQKVKWLKDWSEYSQPDYVELYEKGVLTESVAKEMQKQGMIQDYKSLMNKLKLSDPLEQKAQKEKIIKELAKLKEKQYKTMSDIFEDIYTVKRPKRKKVKSLIKASNAVGSGSKNYLKANTASMKAIIRKIENVK